MSEDFLPAHCVDTRTLATGNTRAQRIFFDKSFMTPEIPANDLTALHIHTKSYVEIRAWDKAAIAVKCPERAYPFEVATQANRVVINEKSLRPKSTIIVFAPRRLDFLNLTLRDDAVCLSDVAAHLASVTTLDQSGAFIQARHLFAQTIGQSRLHATMVPRPFNGSNGQQCGHIMALYAGESMTIAGTYDTAKIAFTGPHTLLHPAQANALIAYLLPHARTGRNRDTSPVIKMSAHNTLEQHIQIANLGVTQKVFQKTMGTLLHEMLNNCGIRP